MYNLSQLKKGVKNPKRGLIEIYSRYKTRRIEDLGEKVLKKEWDNLVILDACRYDVFQEINTLPGDLDSITSMGSSTQEFTRRNFAGKKVPDTVYVYSKPNPAQLDAKFHNVYNIWRELEGESADGWGDGRFVPNELMTERACEIATKHPDKRLIIHYTPPHLPFIGPEGQKLHEEYTWNITEFYKIVANGEINEQILWEAYQENLEVTLPHIKKLYQELSGKTVVTSDHGQAFGEWGVYWHPSNVHIDALREVPWLEMPYEERKEITVGNANKDFIDYELEEVNERLEHLGYKV